MKLLGFIFVVCLLNSLCSFAHAERLSLWLANHPTSQNDYLPGLSWNTPIERAQQFKIKIYLMDQLKHNPNVSSRSIKQNKSLLTFIQSLPVTGRVPVRSTNIAWLAANPKFDPQILPLDQIIIPPIPHQVSVIDAEGNICQVIHHSNYSIQDYLKACHQQSTDNSDYAWLIQADGTISKGSIAYWKPERLDYPSPGSWIWAPSVNDKWNQQFSDQLAAFLATQGPALDLPTVITVKPTMPAIELEKPWHYTANDWGEIGLLQSPTARMRPAGDFSFTYSDVLPYIRGNVFLQPLDWFEIGFRYTDITNKLYGPQSLSGSQNYIDKSIDTKFRLHQETALTPQIALGLRDFVGTGLWSSEYFVASKHTPHADWSLGIGWGYMAGSGSFANPLDILSSRFTTRSTATSSTGGLPSFGNYFTGPASIFGGVEYQTPWDPLRIKIEYDGNNYKQEPLGEIINSNSRWNAGLVYEASSFADLTAGYERGNQFMFSINLHTNLKDLQMPKLSDPPLIPISNTYPQNEANWKITSLDIETQTKWKVIQISQNKNILFIDIANPHNVYWREYLDRAIRVLHRDTSFGIDYFVFRIHEEGLLVAEEHVDRGAWLTQHTEQTPPSLQELAIIPVAPLSTLSQNANSDHNLNAPSPQTHYISSVDSFEFENGLNFNYFLGGPNNFILYSLAPYEEVKYHINNTTWLQGTAQYNVLDNYNNFTYDAPSNLPRVRTYIREYVTTSRLTMPNLQLTTVKNIAPDQYLSFYAGYLEMMFGGVGSEWLYRPFDSQFALGVDINEVQQRNFNVGFGFMNYRVLTGLATLYWDTGWQAVQTRLSMGRYLAGDVGATLDIAKQFKNGVKMGAYATKTNVTSAQFGEGSIDKGIYVNIPFDALLTRSTDLTAHFLWEPLLRDGGARLNRAVQLYDLTSVRSHKALQTEPSPAPNQTLSPEYQSVLTTSSMVTPNPYLVAHIHASKGEWDKDTYHYSYDLESDLYKEGFTQINVLYDDFYRLHVDLTPPHYPKDSEAAGQALRVIVNRMPLDTREIVLTLHQEIVYTFHDIKKLNDYLNGLIDNHDFASTVTVHYLKNGIEKSNFLFGITDVTTEITPLTAGDAFIPHRSWINRIYTDFKSGLGESRNLNWENTLLVGSGLVLGSAILDNPFDRFALQHGQGSLISRFKQVGNDLPFVATGVAGLIALSSQNIETSDTGYSAGEAAVSGYILSLGIKTVVGRSRPFTNQGNSSFHFLHGSASSGTDSFPSAHNIVTWAAITPFAKEYNAPWLYAVAGITNASRVLGRNHWFSDTVAGAFMGYTLGDLFYTSQKERENAPEIYITPTGVNMDMKF